MALNIGIIVGTTREGRVSPQVASWVQEKAKTINNNNYTIVDIKDFKLPLLGETADTTGIEKWNQTLAGLDGFIFVTGEYNHSLPASLKNALDSAKEVWANKPAGIVSYGSVGGTRAAEHLRTILGELQMADVRGHVALSMFTDFEQWQTFKPQPLHDQNMGLLLTQLDAWGNALKTIR
jgi:NAD(P)H-dependent FMN reductase